MIRKFKVPGTVTSKSVWGLNSTLVSVIRCASDYATAIRVRVFFTQPYVPVKMEEVVHIYDLLLKRCNLKLHL